MHAFMKNKIIPRNQDPKLQQIAAERIEILFREAKLNPEYANRYVFLARKIAMKLNVKIPKGYKMRYCHKCYKYFSAGNFSFTSIGETIK